MATTSANGPGAASPFTSRDLTPADNNARLICATAQTANVPKGLGMNFGCAFKGTITVTAGTSVVITDVRTTGATNPWCTLEPTAMDTYDVVGSKP